MIGRVTTGTGKTLDFGIPIMDKTIQYNKKHGCETLLLLLRTSVNYNIRERNPLAIVMAPIKQLARQVGKEFYESAPEIDTICVYSGSAIQCYMSTLNRGVDVTVGTLDVLFICSKGGALNLSEVGDSDQKLADGITWRQSDMTETNALATKVEYLLFTSFHIEVSWSNECPLENKELNSIIGAWFTLWRD
ncbi:DEAD-box ATP-dependent RNA helicase 53, mitochondrial-like protein [Tanacetum coccineum]